MRCFLGREIVLLLALDFLNLVGVEVFGISRTWVCLL